MPRKSRPTIRTDILDAASDLLESSRVGEVTVDAISRQVKMSKSTLYKHFRDKNDVLVTLIRGRCEWLDGQLAGLVGEDPEGLLEALGGILAELAQRLPRAVFLERSSLPVECVVVLGRAEGVLLARCRGIVEQGVEQGSFGPLDSALVASAWTSSAWGAVRAASLGDVRMDRAEAARSAMRLMVCGMCASRLAA